MTDEEAMEALLNSDGYSFPTWTLKLGLPTDEMRLVMSLIASDKAPIPVDVAYISEYLHMDGAVVESSVKELLDRRLVYKKDSYLILDLEMCDHIFDAAATVRQAKVNSDIDEAFCPPIPLVAMRAGEIYSDSSLVSRLVLGFISAWSFAADFCPYCPHDIAKLLGLYDSDVEDARVEVVDQYVVIRETHEFPIVGEWTRDRRKFLKCEIRIHVPAGSIAQGEYDIT